MGYVKCCLFDQRALSSYMISFWFTTLHQKILFAYIYVRNLVPVEEIAGVNLARGSASGAPLLSKFGNLSSPENFGTYVIVT